MAIGSRVPMIDALQRVTGVIDYASNVRLPGSLWARLVTSPYPHARIAAVDASAALRLPGVRAVISGSDLPALGLPTQMGGRSAVQRPILCFDRVRYVGDPVVAIAAEDDDAAREAASLVSIAYEELPSVTDLMAAIGEGAPVIHGSSNLAAEHHIVKGDVGVGFAEADEIYEDTFSTPAVQHVPLEPHCCVASFEDGRLLVWTSSQNPFGVRDELASLLGISNANVRVVVPSLGGGFGSKLSTWVEPIAVALVRATARPIKLTLSRAEEFASFVRHASHTRLRTGVMRDGRIVAREALCYLGTGAYGTAGLNGIANAASATSSAYRIPHVKADVFAVYTNTVPGGAFRAPGAPQMAWASEVQLAMIARRLGIDPLELRRINLLRDGDSFVAGGVLEDLHFDELFTSAAADLGWHTGDASYHSATRYRIGRAIVPTLKTTRTPSVSDAALELDREGGVHLMSGAVEMGQGSRTALAQIAADAVGVPYESVAVEPVDTDVVPFQSGTASSRTTYTVGGSVMRAGEDLHRQLRELAAEEFDVAPEDVALTNGRASVRGAPEQERTFGEVVTSAPQSTLIGTGRFETVAAPDPLTGQPSASSHWHHGVAAAEVVVDVETGRVEVTRVWAGVFAGRVINPSLCELQAQGCLLFGMGQALFEDMHYADGTLITNSLAEYNIPSLRDAPPSFTTRLLEEPDAGEIHGIGETLMPAGPAVIGCAVADAIGIHLPDLPLTPERILRALRGADAPAPEPRA